MVDETMKSVAAVCNNSSGLILRDKPTVTLKGLTILPNDWYTERRNLLKGASIVGSDSTSICPFMYYQVGSGRCEVATIP